jgi:hypothetical protein
MQSQIPNNTKQIISLYLCFLGYPSVQQTKIMRKCLLLWQEIQLMKQWSVMPSCVPREKL